MICKSRSSVPIMGDRYACGNINVFAPTGVDDGVCRSCPYRDGDEWPQPVPERDVVKNSCVHLQEQIEEIECPTCIGRTRIKLFGCEIHQRCTLAFKVNPNTMTCVECPDYVPSTD